MDRFLQLPFEVRAEMGDKARRKMEHEFDRKIVVNAYLQEINKVCNNN